MAMTTAAQRVTLPELHPSQLVIAQHPARFKVICCGRRWGKTILGIVLCISAALRGGRVWWVAPAYKEALEGWEYLRRLVVGVTYERSELVARFPGGGSIQIRTGDNPDALRGAGLDGVVLDEAAVMKREAWELALRPALVDRQGWAVFISTPQHFNWFYDLYAAAERQQDDTWACWQRPSWDNPYLAESEITQAQRDMTPEDFDQEFGASFTAVGGAVFRELSANRPLYLRPMPQGTIFRRMGVGLDWGTTPQHQSAVVCGGVTSTGAVWIRSAWLSPSGSANEWYDEAVRARRDYGAAFARVDRSQSSALDRLGELGFEAQKGVADVEARIGDFQGLVLRRAIFFDLHGPGVREYYNHLCAYHRKRTGEIAEEEDDDVDAGCYLVSELVRPNRVLPTNRMELRPRGPEGGVYGMARV